MGSSREIKGQQWGYQLMSVRTVLRRAVLVGVVATEDDTPPLGRHHALVPPDRRRGGAVPEVLLHEGRLAAPAKEVLLGVPGQHDGLVERAGELGGEGGVARVMDGEGGGRGDLCGVAALVGESTVGGAILLACYQGRSEGLGQKGGCEESGLHL